MFYHPFASRTEAHVLRTGLQVTLLWRSCLYLLANGIGYVHCAYLAFVWVSRQMNSSSYACTISVGVAESLPHLKNPLCFNILQVIPCPQAVIVVPCHFGIRQQPSVKCDNLGIVPQRSSIQNNLSVLITLLSLMWFKKKKSLTKAT